MRESYLFMLLLAGAASFAHSRTALAPFAPECANDLPCQAFDLGLLDAGAQLGDAQLGGHDNFCGTNAQEPNPINYGQWYNDAGVWFSFRTGPNPSPLILVQALSDPLITGQAIDLEVAVFTSSNGACTGVWRLAGAAYSVDAYDALVAISCPRPNTQYFILVDGQPAAMGGAQGSFGLQVRDVAVREGPNSRCQAEYLGQVPEGGAAATDGPRSNFCAVSVGDPPVSTFATQVTVWFTFRAPPSGHVYIEVLAGHLEYPLGVQLALFRSANQLCWGAFQEVASVFTPDDWGETLYVPCLRPGELYWIMIDGFGDGGKGMFTLSVSDGGDIRPLTRIDTVLCHGDSLRVGASVYWQTGEYQDTLRLASGCDSVVATRLTVLPPLTLAIEQHAPAIWGGRGGSASALAAGGAGAYRFVWSDGVEGPSRDDLAAGQTYCAQVIDERQCQGESCLNVAFRTVIVPQANITPPNCHGGEDGAIRLRANGGIGPYRYVWRQIDGPRNGQGELPAGGVEAGIGALTGGAYQVSIADAYGDTAFTVFIPQPDLLEARLLEARDVSCFERCDGRLSVDGAGGVSPYQVYWRSEGKAGETTLGDLCPGVYVATIRDANACEAEAAFEVGRPPELTLRVEELQPARCFDGDDGIAEAFAGAPGATFIWSNGEQSAIASGLRAGVYTVTATDAAGCQASAEVLIQQPAAPLSVDIELLRPITCHGDADAALRAKARGPAPVAHYAWSNGAASAEAWELPPGEYAVTVIDAQGCAASASVALSAPPPITARVAVRDLTCLDPDNGGGIAVGEVAGGVPGYEFSLDGVWFQASPFFDGLFPGEYEALVRDQSGCEAAFPAVVLAPPQLTVDLGENRIIDLGESLRLHAAANSEHLRYRWLPSPDYDAKNAASIVVTPLHSTNFRVEATDTLTFCTASSELYVTVRKERKVYIPNAFSPNGDGRNDVFMIYGGRGIARVRQLRVFHRNGALLYETRDFLPGDIGAGWDGWFRGRPMAGGVYVYFADIEFIDGEREIFRGDVLLAR